MFDNQGNYRPFDNPDAGRRHTDEDSLYEAWGRYNEEVSQLVATLEAMARCVQSLAVGEKETYTPEQLTNDRKLSVDCSMIHRDYRRLSDFYDDYQHQLWDVNHA